MGGEGSGTNFRLSIASNHSTSTRDQTGHPWLIRFHAKDRVIIDHLSQYRSYRQIRSLLAIASVTNNVAVLLTEVEDKMTKMFVEQRPGGWNVMGVVIEDSFVLLLPTSY